MPSSDRFQKRGVNFGLVAWAGFSLIFLALLLFSSFYLPLPARAGTTFTVTSLLDTDGPTCAATCTLRQAINAANNNPGQDVITFNITGTIAPITPLPFLFDDAGTIIDGGNNFGITISGDQAGNHEHGIRLYSQNNTVKGLVIRGFSGTITPTVTNFAAVYTDRSNNNVTGNIIGANADGSVVTYPNSYGIYVSANGAAGVNVSNINISDNFIAGNSDSGIYFFNNTNNTLTGITVTDNIIGPDKTGNSLYATFRQKYGIYFNGDVNGTTIGGPNTSDGNTISGNYEAGIYFLNATNGGITLQRNYIGPNKNGNAPLKVCTNVNDLPQKWGIALQGTNSNITIGGAAAGNGNLISGNCDTGIYFLNSIGTSNLISGNLIGPNNTGTNQISSCNGGNISPTQRFGIYFNGKINAGAGVTIGGTSAGSRNIISGNCDSGIYYLDANGTGNQILGNYIGPDKNGLKAVTSPVQNKGIVVQGSSSNVIIGGSVPNVISGNIQDGIIFNNLTVQATGNRVAGNYIGPDFTGNSALSDDQQVGILFVGYDSGGHPVGSSNVQVGGPGGGTDTRNIISANTQWGISLIKGSINNVLLNNYIGYKVDGVGTLRNGSGNGTGSISIPTGTQLKFMGGPSSNGNRVNAR